MIKADIQTPHPRVHPVTRLHIHIYTQLHLHTIHQSTNVLGRHLYHNTCTRIKSGRSGLCSTDLFNHCALFLSSKNASRSPKEVLPFEMFNFGGPIPSRSFFRIKSGSTNLPLVLPAALALPLEFAPIAPNSN